jgi:hypothetical protein
VDEQATVQVVVNGEPRGTVELTPESADVLHVVDATAWLQPGENTVTIAGPAGAPTGLMAQVVARSFVPWPAEPPALAADEPLELTVEYDRQELAVDDVVRARVTLHYRQGRTADNAIIDLGIPPGFDPLTEDLDRAVAQGTIARWELTERQIIFYVGRLEPESTLLLDYGLRARYPLRAHTPASEAYLYYEPEVRTSVQPVEIVVVDGD